MSELTEIRYFCSGQWFSKVEWKEEDSKKDEKIDLDICQICQVCTERMSPRTSLLKEDFVCYYWCTACWIFTYPLKIFFGLIQIDLKTVMNQRSYGEIILKRGE